MQKFVGVILALGLMAPVLADPKLDVKVKPFSDRIEIEVKSAAPLQPQLGTNSIRLGTGPVVGTGVTPIDKGLIQKVEVVQLKGKGGAEIKVFAISNPKTSVRVSADKKLVTYVISVNDLASSGGAAQLFGPKPANSPPPVTVKSPPPVTVKSPPPVAVNSPSQIPRNPLPAATPEPTPPPTPAEVAVGERPVSLTIAGGDLPSALQALAQAAGLQADVAPGVQGFVTASFTNIPLNQALTSMLGQQSNLYEYKITGTHLKVWGEGVNVTARSGRIAREYFPVKGNTKAVDVLLSLKRLVPELNYSVDERLNQILAEGDPADLDRARSALKSVSDK